MLKVVNNSKPISTEYVQENARKKKTFDELNKLGADTENIQTDVARTKSSRNKKSEKYIEYQKSLQKTSSKLRLEPKLKQSFNRAHAGH